MSGIHVASLNINRARQYDKKSKLYEQKRVDVVMLQEMHSDASNAADWVTEWDWLVSLSHNSSLSGVVALLFARNFIPSSYTVEEVLNGRLLKVRAFHENVGFVFIRVHAHQSSGEIVVLRFASCSAADILISMLNGMIG